MLVRATILKNQPGIVVTEVVTPDDHLGEVVDRVIEALARSLGNGGMVGTQDETRRLRDV